MHSDAYGWIWRPTLGYKKCWCSKFNQNEKYVYKILSQKLSFGNITVIAPNSSLYVFMFTFRNDWPMCKWQNLRRDKYFLLKYLHFFTETSECLILRFQHPEFVLIKNCLSQLVEIIQLINNFGLINAFWCLWLNLETHTGV